jgi:hypothetical protein
MPTLWTTSLISTDERIGDVYVLFCFFFVFHWNSVIVTKYYRRKCPIDKIWYLSNNFVEFASFQSTISKRYPFINTLLIVVLINWNMIFVCIIKLFVDHNCSNAMNCLFPFFLRTFAEDIEPYINDEPNKFHAFIDAYRQDHRSAYWSGGGVIVRYRHWQQLVLLWEVYVLCSWPIWDMCRSLSTIICNIRLYSHWQETSRKYDSRIVSIVIVWKCRSKIKNSDIHKNISNTH